MKGDIPTPASRWGQAVYVTVIYGGIALLFTLFGLFLGPRGAQVGGTRAMYTIPEHVLELAGFGLLLGLGCMLIYGRKGLPFVFLISVLTPLLDIDHLPAYLGYAQTIRPAHSIVFLFAVLAVTAVTIRDLDIELVVVSAFMGHLAVDTGLFAPFSPISFEYIQLDPYRPFLAVGAVVCALTAGAALRARRIGKISGGDKEAARPSEASDGNPKLTRESRRCDAPLLAQFCWVSKLAHSLLLWLRLPATERL
jgi:hypothetical protein